MMPTVEEKAKRFLELHRPGDPLLMPNPWDSGSARVLVAEGFEALATTSSGFAMTLGRLDGGVTRGEALAHAAAISAAVDVPVSADLENCFADDPEGVAETVGLAAATGLAGCSVEDSPGEDVYDARLALERVRAAVEVKGPLVLTARAENFLRGHPDLDDTIERLLSFEDAGADVLFAPGLREVDQVRRIVEAVDAPVSVLVGPRGPTIAELAEVGVARISVGGGLAFTALGALVDAARELQAKGDLSYGPLLKEGRDAAGRALG